MLACKILTTEAEIEAIADEWRQLPARAGCGAFSDYDLVHIWWRTIGKDYGNRRLHIVIARDNGRLVGVLPLTVVSRQGLRVMQAAGYKGYGCCDMLAENAEQAAALWQAARQSPHYDFASIRDVYPDTMPYAALSSFARKRDLSEALFLRFAWKTGDEWLASLSHKFTRNIKRCMRLLEAKAPVSYEIYTEGPLPLAVIDEMVTRKKTWCLEHGEGGLLLQPGVYDYFHRLIEMLARQDRVFLIWIRCGADIVGVDLCIRYRNVMHAYVISYDPAWASYSPGNILFTKMIGWGIEHGYSGLNLRQGGSDYKAKFTNETCMCAEFTFSGSVSGRLKEIAFVAARRAARAVGIRKF